MTVTISDRSVKRIFGAVVIVTLLAVTVLQTNLMTGNAAKKVGFTSASVEVVPNPSSTPSNGVFSMEGNIYAQGGVNPSTGVPRPGEPVIGTWRAWGFKFAANRASMNESFELDGFLGAIQGQGTVELANDPATTADDIQSVLRNEAMAVSGGTGNFSGAQGTGQMKPLGPNGAFRVTFPQAGERP